MFQQFTQYAMELSTLPINIVFHISGNIAFVRTCNFSAIVEHINDDVTLVIDSESLNFQNKDVAKSFEVPYNTLVAWKDNEVLLKWLQDQQLVMPKFN